MENIRTFEWITSTNDVMRTKLRWPAPNQRLSHGAVISAVSQEKGRGRLGRSWWSHSGAVMMSVVLVPKADHPHLSALTLEAGAAVVEAIPGRFEARLKWPNDIMIRGRKLGGILCERDELPDGRLAIIVGIGVNVDVPEAAFPQELRGIATSLSIEDPDPPRNYGIELMIARIRDLLVARFARFEEAGLDVATAEALSVTVGGRVRDEAGREGQAVGIAPSGALKVRWDGTGTEAEVVAGDIVGVAA